MDDLISRKAAIEAAKHAWAKGLEPSQYIEIIPTAPSVPLDKLCEWLAERYAVPCRAFDEPEKLFCGQCYEEGISNVECWKRYMIKWMEDNKNAARSE